MPNFAINEVIITQLKTITSRIGGRLVTQKGRDLKMGFDTPFLFVPTTYIHTVDLIAKKTYTWDRTQTCDALHKYRVRTLSSFHISSMRHKKLKLNIFVHTGPRLITWNHKTAGDSRYQRARNNLQERSEEWIQQRTRERIASARAHRPPRRKLTAPPPPHIAFRSLWFIASSCHETSTLYLIRGLVKLSVRCRWRRLRSCRNATVSNNPRIVRFKCDVI